MRCSEFLDCQIRDIPYEEYFSGPEELETLLAKNSPLYHTFWDLACHHYICSDLRDAKKGVVWPKKWAN